MNTLPSSSVCTATVHQIRAAIVRGDAGLLARTVASANTQTLAAAGDTAMGERRWTDAASLFDSMAERDNATTIKRCLCRNLASLQRWRREVYEELISLPERNHCGIGVSTTNHPTIIIHRSDGQNVSLSPGNAPLTAMASTMAQLKPTLDAGVPLALCGVGDGYLLHQLAQRPPKLFMDQQQCIFLMEPDAHILLTAMMIHDYTGPTGPIEQRRFQWMVGSDWTHALRTTMLADRYLPGPHLSLKMSLNWETIQSALQSVMRDVEARDARAKHTIEKYYSAMKPADFSAAFLGNSPRKPRVLLLTTRFSTVLQYATQDAAAGFEQAGWETHVVIEPTPHHRVLAGSIRAAVAEFRPDLVFQLDHLRHEHVGMFPANLPFVCWIQDHMPHLMKADVGSKIGPADFVLTDAGATYVHTAGYPKRQIISLSKLTTPPKLLPRPATSAEDIVFISNATKTPDALLATFLNQFRGDTQTQAFMTECVRRATELHAGGEALATFPDISRFVREIVAEMKLSIEPEPLHLWIRSMTHPLCDALYRHQTIRWTIAAAESLRLTVGLYGNGWDAHEEFAPYARGPVAAGEDFRALTRRAAVNLQIAPYLCLHQRMLDGICSGAFFLVREHVADTAPQALLDLLELNAPSNANSVDEARAMIPISLKERFEFLVAESRRALCPMESEDPIEVLRMWQEARLYEPLKGVLPHLEAVSFVDAESLRLRLARFTRDPELRERITADQRESILGRLTYSAAIARITRRMGQLFGEQQFSRSPAAPTLFETGRAA